MTETIDAFLYGLLAGTVTIGMVTLLWSSKRIRAEREVATSRASELLEEVVSVLAGWQEVESSAKIALDQLKEAMLPNEVEAIIAGQVIGLNTDFNDLADLRSGLGDLLLSIPRKHLATTTMYKLLGAYEIRALRAVKVIGLPDTVKKTIDNFARAQANVRNTLRFLPDMVKALEKELGALLDSADRRADNEHILRQVKDLVQSVEIITQSVANSHINDRLDWVKLDAELHRLLNQFKNIRGSAVDLRIEFEDEDLDLVSG